MSLGTQGSVGQRQQSLLSTPNGKASLPKCDSRQRQEMIFVLTIATILLTPRDQEKVSEWSPAMKGHRPTSWRPCVIWGKSTNAKTNSSPELGNLEFFHFTHSPDSVEATAWEGHAMPQRWVEMNGGIYFVPITT